MKILETIGFDLGHGETAVAKAIVESAEPPEMLEVNNKKVQITALGKHPNLGYLVGEQALIQAGVTQLEIAFKQKPNADLNYRQIICNFLTTYYRLLKESRQIEGGIDSHFYIGCPSGWTHKEREDYQKLLQQSGVPLLSVIPESRAAFMQAKEAGKLDYDKLKSSVLIVDIGSSTTDFTLVKSLHEIPLDFGSNALGASLIDKAIFARTLANHEQKELLEKVFEEYPHHKARCELACRKAKEDYFSNEQVYSESHTFARGFESINEQIYFIPRVNQAIAREILNQPLAELDNKSWSEAFRAAVAEAKKTLDEQSLVPKVVLMTGGASRMKFTRDICEEIFSDRETQVRPDPEPERCIALGLARVGRWDLRAAAFTEEVNKVLEAKKLKGLVEQHVPELVELLIAPLSGGLLENAVKPALKDWQSNKLRTIADLEISMRRRAEQWIESPPARQIIDEKCVAWFNSKIQPALAEKTDPICRQYQIPRSSLRFEEGIDPGVVNPELSIGDALLADIVGFIVNLAVGGSTIGSIILIILTGHLTWPIALVYGASLVAVGVEVLRTKKQLQDVIKTQVDVPWWSRSTLLNDGKIEEICNKMNPDLEKLLREQLTANREAFDELIEKVGQGLKNALNAKVREAIILIQ